jgi:hypothetical protein
MELVCLNETRKTSYLHLSFGRLVTLCKSLQQIIDKGKRQLLIGRLVQMLQHTAQLKQDCNY